MTSPKIPVWLLPAILLTALLSLYSISYRYKVEQRNKAVSIATEYENIESLAAAQGIPIEKALADLKLQGLQSVVLSEESIGDLVVEGQGSFYGGRLEVPFVGGTHERVARGLRLRFQSVNESSALGQAGEEPLQELHLFHLPASPSTVRGVSIGLNPDQAATVKSAGLGIIARMNNPLGVTGDYVRQTLDWAHELGATVFLPSGDQVLGRRDSLGDMTDELQKLGMLYASPEFAKLGGDQNVLEKVPQSVVRLHSAQSAELDKMPFSEGVDRYSRAARERGMRILLVRPITSAAPEPLTAFSEFVKAINRDVEKQGDEMGVAHPYDDPKVPSWLFALIGLSLVPTGYFVGATFVKKPMWRIVGLVLLVLLGLACYKEAGRSYGALAASLIFPTAAFLILDARKKINIVLDFIIVSLTSLVGGLAIAGLLNSLSYYIRAEQFEGVKLAVFLPILLVAIYYALRVGNLKESLKSPITWGASLIALLVLAALMFMSSRTGNDNPAGVSGFELKMRFLLDQILFVRPRTKEFMIGHPLLILGIGMLAIYRKKPSPSIGLWAALAIAGGAIGQTSIVNTMCHIHTPVTLSLARIGVGIVAGVIIGLVVWTIARRWLPKGDI